MQVVAGNYFQAVVGQPELIGKGSASTPRANVSISLGSHPASLELHGPTLLSRAAAHWCLMGQFELLVTTSQCMKSAHASACV